MNISPSIEKIARKAQKWRRYLHSKPGIAYNEKDASEFVKDKLIKWGYGNSIDTGWGKNPNAKSVYKGGHGIVLTIDGDLGKGDTIGIRADMDALPITEQTNLGYASQNRGVMHACGHDGHTATLLAVAKHFSKASNRNFRGQLKLIFQPAEEGAKGAKAMLDEGLLKKHPMSAIFAMHNWPDLPVGQIAVHEGPVMASSSYVDIEITGKSSHAAKPEEGLSAGRIMSRIQLAADHHNKTCAPDDRFVVALEAMKSKGTKTAIASKATLSGTIRTFNPNVLTREKANIERIVQEAIDLEKARVNSDFKATANVTFHDGSPATINTPELAQWVRKAAQDTVGDENVLWNLDPETTAEDFGFFVGKVPLCYFWVGQAEPKKPATTRVLHNDGYDFNDDILPIAAQTFVNLVHNRLG